jgi:hypothetical protein
MSDEDIQTAVGIALGVLLVDEATSSAEMLTGNKLRMSVSWTETACNFTRRIRAEDRTEEAITDLVNGFVRSAILGAFGEDIFRPIEE